MKLRRYLSETDGLAVVEMAFVVPVLITIVFMCLQFALVFMAYMSVLYTGRDVARWLAVHPDTTDASVVAAVAARLPTDLDSSKMTVVVTPSCPTLDSQSRCDNRSIGTQLSLTLTYDASSVFFLPRPPGVPATFPPYTMYFMDEVN